MIEKLKTLIFKIGIVKVANDLGYRSPATISYWIKINRVPIIAEQKVTQYLKGLKK